MTPLCGKVNVQFNAYTGPMQHTPYGGGGAQLAAAVVNAGPDAPPEAYEELIERYDYRGTAPVTATEARELGEWAVRLRRVFDATELPARVDLANELLTAVAARPYISRHHGRPPHFHYARADAPTAQRIKAYTAVGLAQAVCEDSGRIGICARAGCVTAYVDTSRNGRRRFCSPECANRSHVAAHRSRRRAA